ncbi:MAG: four helix bundle protein [Candidatus Vogelbacteria bacterium]|nr:four helix bundle protein [Candidatus Vogelbacteria bacterium]
MINHFKDLVVYQKSHTLAVEVYKVTRKFPNSEIFALANQMQRAAVSVTSNIAEGFSRKTVNEKLQFYSFSKGSLYELQSQLLISKDLGYVNPDAVFILENLIDEVGRLLTGVQQALK